MTTGDGDWSSVDLTEDPRLIVGRRASASRLEGSRVDLHEDTFSTLRGIASDALGALGSTSARPYEPFAALEEGEEHFELTLDTPVGSEPDADVSDLTRLITIVDDLPSIDARNLREERSLFYALCWPSDSGHGRLPGDGHVAARWRT